MSTNQQVSVLPTATSPLNSSDLLYVIQGGVSKKAPVSFLPSSGGGGGGGGPLFMPIVDLTVSRNNTDSGSSQGSYHYFDINIDDSLGDFGNYWNFTLASSTSVLNIGTVVVRFNIVNADSSVFKPLYFSLDAGGVPITNSDSKVALFIAVYIGGIPGGGTQTQNTVSSYDIHTWTGGSLPLEFVLDAGQSRLISEDPRAKHLIGKDPFNVSPTTNTGLEWDNFQSIADGSSGNSYTSTKFVMPTVSTRGIGLGYSFNILFEVELTIWSQSQLTYSGNAVPGSISIPSQIDFGQQTLDYTLPIAYNPSNIITFADGQTVSLQPGFFIGKEIRTVLCLIQYTNDTAYTANNINISFGYDNTGLSDTYNYRITFKPLVVLNWTAQGLA